MFCQSEGVLVVLFPVNLEDIFSKATLKWTSGNWRFSILFLSPSQTKNIFIVPFQPGVISVVE